MMTRLLHLGLLCWTSLMAAPDDAMVTMPRLGYLFEAGPRVLRSVDGIPGAALLGSAIELGFPIADAVVSPDQTYALAINADNRAPYAVSFGRGSWNPQEVLGARYPVDSVVLSPSGRSAALYNVSEGVIQVVRGLPDTPVVDHELHLTNLDHMAVSDDGALVLASQLGHSGPVLAWRGNQTSRDLPILGPVSAIALRPQSHDALIANGAGVTLIHESDTRTEYRLFPETAGYCVGLAFSQRGERFFAAYHNGTILSYDLPGEKSTNLSCHCVPKFLQQLSPDSVLRLNEGEQEPMRILDGTRNRVLFVPKGNFLGHD